MLNFVKSFLCIFWDDHMVLPFDLLILCITLIVLCILKNPWIPGIKSTWSWCMILFMSCWILFVRILLRIFFFFTWDPLSIYFMTYISILANYHHCSGEAMISLLGKQSDHTVFYLQRLRVDLKINPNQPG